MPSFKMICLANSFKHGGRCIAGFKTDGSGWLRPISSKFDGTLYEEHYTLANGQEPQLFNIIKIECTQPRPEWHQPENWIISNRRWQLVGYPTREQLNNLLAKEIKRATNSPTLLSNQSDRIEWDLQHNPPPASLCLIHPPTIQWQLSTKPYSNKKKFRAIFSLQETQYNLGITDPIWQNILNQLPDGEYTSEQIVDQLELENFNPDRFLLTISLSEPFQPSELDPIYCFKLVAAVINAENVVKTLIN